MASRKQLYEASQAQQALINSLQEEVKQLKNMPLYSTSGYDKINPIIANDTSYDIVLQKQDEIVATNRYITEIPELKLPSNRLEDLFYKYGSLCLFNDENDGMLPKIATYAKTGELNGLGDLTQITPIDFAGKTHKTAYTVVYDDKAVARPAVIINDYTGAYREEQIIPRMALNLVSIRDQALVYRKMKNAIRITALKAIALINDESQRQAIEKTVSDFFYNDAPVASIIGSNLNDVVKIFNVDTKLDIQGYLSAIDTFERLRTTFNGVKTASPIEKKERLVTAEAESSEALQRVYLMDGLLNRQIGIEMAKKHAIIKEGSSKLNPIFEQKESSKKLDDKKEKDNASSNSVQRGK